jgi:hypothetical protein
MIEETKKSKLSFEDACFQWASNQFLYEEIPDEYFEWSEDAQHEHLERYAWEPISHHYGYKIANYIDSLADHIIEEVYPKKEDYG